MSRTLKKQSRLKFDTSLNNLKCFIQQTNKLKISEIDSHSKTSRKKTKQKSNQKKKIQFQDKDFISSVVCNVLNDANTQEITELIDNMNFPTNYSQKEPNRSTPSEEIEHMEMRQIFNSSTSRTPQSYSKENQQKKLNGQNQAMYYLTPLSTQDYRMMSTPEKIDGPSTFQSSFSDSFSLSPQEQKVYQQYSSYNYAYLYYQNTSLYRQQQKKPRKNNLIDESSQYKIVLEKIQSDGRTTLMIRHIPNKYSQDLLFQELSKNYKNKINFLYLPLDSYNQCNVGYAFINFIHAKFINSFYKEFNGRKWQKFNSEKRCELAYARIQGANSLINHFENGLASIKARNKEERKGKGSVDYEGDGQGKQECVNLNQESLS